MHDLWGLRIGGDTAELEVAVFLRSCNPTQVSQELIMLDPYIRLTSIMIVKMSVTLIYHIGFIKFPLNLWYYDTKKLSLKPVLFE